VFSFLDTLGRYESTESLVDRVWNPYQLVSLILVAGTGWLGYRLRYFSADQPSFWAFLVWTVCLNAIVAPLFGMLHIVIIGPVFVILLAAVVQLAPRQFSPIWWTILALFVAGLGAFIAPLALSNSPGLHIASAEAVYKITMPLFAGLTALWLLWKTNRRNLSFT
jgi:hypothetical protein